MPEMLVYDDVYVTKIRDLIARQEKFILKSKSNHAKYTGVNTNGSKRKQH